MSARKVVEIEGVGVQSLGCVGARGGGWHGVALLRPWRVLPDGEPQNQTLRVLMRAYATSAAAMKAGARVEEGVVHRGRVVMDRASKDFLPGGTLEGRLRRAAASGVIATADAEASKTIRRNDPVLGRLVRHARQQAYVGRVTVLGRSVPLVVTGSIEGASALFAHVGGRIETLPEDAVRTMLPLANRVWLDTPIRAEQFLRRIKPTEVELDATSVRIRFSCGTTFGEHGLLATLTRRRTKARIEIE